MKKNFISSRLTQYSAMAGAIVSASASQAQIVYTDIVPDVVLNPGEEYLIDLNNNNEFEFIIANEFNYMYVINYMAYEHSQLFVFEDEATDDRVVTPLDYGFPINSELILWDNYGVLANDEVDVWEGQQKYVAVRWRIDNDELPGDNYGWIMIAVAPDQSTITVKDFAYQADPNTTILAGEGTGQTGNCDVYEPNNKFADAAPIATNQEILSLINPSGDKDFFVFNVSSNEPNLRITLSGMTKNYDVVLFNSGKEKIGKSKNLQREDDIIIYNNAAPGIYYLKVFQKDGNFDPDNCYSLVAEASSTPFKISATESNSNFTELLLYPNPADGMITIQWEKAIDDEVLISIFDAAGMEVLKSASHVSGHSIQIDVSGLTPGMYILKASSDRVLMKKFVVAR